MSLTAKLEALARGFANANAAKAANEWPATAQLSQDSQVSHSQPEQPTGAKAGDIRSFRSFRIRTGESAEAALERFALAEGLAWLAAHSQMVAGDVEAGAAQLAADSGDGIEAAGVACWLRLLASRAPRTRPATPKTAACERETCESCERFEPDPINPPAGVGICLAGVGQLSRGPSLHPMALRACDFHKPAAGRFPAPLTPKGTDPC